MSEIPSDVLAVLGAERVRMAEIMAVGSAMASALEDGARRVRVPMDVDLAPSHPDYAVVRAVRAWWSLVPRPVSPDDDDGGQGA